MRVRAWPIECLLLAAGTWALATPARADDTVRIAVIGEQSSIVGASLMKAAALAAEDVNSHGGVAGRMIELVTYDDHGSAADAVRAFQRAAGQDHVVAVLASYLTEVVQALAPWSARLHMPFITPGATSDAIPEQIHKDYDRFKYVFHGWRAATFLGQSICNSSHDLLAAPLHMQTSVVLSEDAAWTRPLDARLVSCLPQAGLRVLDHIRFNPDTTDFTPIYRRIEAEKPDVIIAGMSHVGVLPTVQWHEQQVPIAMAGENAQATTTGFWADTQAAADGVMTVTAATPDVAITPVTQPFAKAYRAKYGSSPAYAGYSSYDMIHILAEAVARAGSTDPDRLVTALEQTDHVGTIGREQFYGRDDPFTHSLRYGPGFVTGVVFQWQNGKQVTLWPSGVSDGQVKFPAFVRLPAPAK